MKYLSLRGNLVGISGKTIFVTINKAQDHRFSLSDKVLAMLGKGYEALVSVNGQKILITKDSPFLFREIVKTKFEGSGDWVRFWFKLPEQKEEKQMEFV